MLNKRKYKLQEILNMPYDTCHIVFMRLCVFKQCKIMFIINKHKLEQSSLRHKLDIPFDVCQKKGMSMEIFICLL